MVDAGLRKDLRLDAIKKPKISVRLKLVNYFIQDNTLTYRRFYIKLWTNYLRYSVRLFYSGIMKVIHIRK